MNKITTNRDVQRATFVESLYTSLKKQAVKAIQDYKHFVVTANSYLQDGLDETECVELLMVDGLSRDAAESYVAMAQANETSDGLTEYSFQVEDESGKIYSSYDLGKVVRASNDEEAWEKAEEMINSDSLVESPTILSVTKTHDA